jgi:hypothetical protein
MNSGCVLSFFSKEINNTPFSPNIIGDIHPYLALVHNVLDVLPTVYYVSSDIMETEWVELQSFRN